MKDRFFFCPLKNEYYLRFSIKSNGLNLLVKIEVFCINLRRKENLTQFLYRILNSRVKLYKWSYSTSDAVETRRYENGLEYLWIFESTASLTLWKFSTNLSENFQPKILEIGLKLQKFHLFEEWEEKAGNFWGRKIRRSVNFNFEPSWRNTAGDWLWTSRHWMWFQGCGFKFFVHFHFILRWSCKGKRPAGKSKTRAITIIVWKTFFWKLLKIFRKNFWNIFKKIITKKFSKRTYSRKLLHNYRRFFSRIIENVSRFIENSFEKLLQSFRDKLLKIFWEIIENVQENRRKNFRETIENFQENYWKILKKIVEKIFRKLLKIFKKIIENVWENYCSREFFTHS